MKKKTKKLLVITSAAVLIPATIVGATFLVLNSKNNQKSSSELENALDPNHQGISIVDQREIESEHLLSNGLKTEIIKEFNLKYQDNVPGSSFTIKNDKDIVLDWKTGIGIAILNETVIYQSQVKVEFAFQTFESYFQDDLKNVGKIESYHSSNDDKTATNEIINRAVKSEKMEEFEKFGFGNEIIPHFTKDTTTWSDSGYRYESNFELKTQYGSTNKIISFYNFEKTDEYQTVSKSMKIINETGQTDDAIKLIQETDSTQTLSKTIKQFYEIDNNLVLGLNETNELYSFKINHENQTATIVDFKTKVDGNTITTVFKTKMGNILVGTNNSRIYDLEINHANGKFLRETKVYNWESSNSYSFNSMIQLDDENNTIIIFASYPNSYACQIALEQINDLFFKEIEVSDAYSLYGAVRTAIKTKDNKYLVGFDYYSYLYEGKYNSNPESGKKHFESFNNTSLVATNYFTTINDLKISETELNNSEQNLIATESSNYNSNTSYSLEKISQTSDGKWTKQNYSINSQINYAAGLIQMNQGNILTSNWKSNGKYQLFLTSTIMEFAK